MTFKEGELRGANSADAVDSDLVTIVRADLAAIDRHVFQRAAPLTLDDRLNRLRATVNASSGPTMVEASVLTAGGLETLADQALFTVQYDAVAAQMADRYGLKIHYNLPALEAAYRSWIGACASAEGNRDHRHFITAVGLLIEGLGRHNIVTYSLMTRPPGPRERQLRAILTYPSEVTALLVGAAVYAVEVERLTGEGPTIPLSGLILENAAAILRRRPEAAARFRELLQLSTPWT